MLDLADSCSHPWTIIPPRLQTYWGSKWRFKIFDGFYTHPKDPGTGLTVDVAKRFAHLQERLGKAAEVCETVVKRSRFRKLRRNKIRDQNTVVVQTKTSILVPALVVLLNSRALWQGTDEWLNLQFDADEDIRKEVLHALLVHHILFPFPPLLHIALTIP